MSRAAADAGAGVVSVFEPEEHGHQALYLEYALRSLAARARPPRVRLLVGPELARGWRGSSWAERHPRLSIEALPLTPEQAARCTTGPLVGKAWSRWRILRRTCAGSGNDVLAFSLDTLQLPLALGLRLRGARLSGILFRPSMHYEGARRPAEIVRDLRKRVLYRRMFANPALATVFVLDPTFPEYARRRLGAAAKAVWLPDPVPEPACVDVEPVQPPAGRTLFVLFGALAARKGVLEALAAFRRLEPAVAERSALVLAGRVDPGLREELTRAIEETRRARPTLWLELLDRSLAEGELTALVRGADVVLAPYQRFVGSSGVLLWAASNDKPVITQSYGLLGRVTREHGLGTAVDTTDPDAIARAVAAYATGTGSPLDPEGRRRFLDGRTPERFGAVLTAPFGPGS